MEEMFQKLWEKKKPIPMAVDPRTLFSALRKAFFPFNKIRTLKDVKWFSWLAFACFCYLSGTRVSEAFSLRFKDITQEYEDAFFVRLKNLKSRIKPMKELPILATKSDKPFFTVFKKFIELRYSEFPPKSEEEKVFDLITTAKSKRSIFFIYLKRKKAILRDVPALDVKNRAWIDYTFTIFPHYLRHCRLTHLVSYYNFSEFDLMTFAGWSSTKPAVFYVRLDARKLMKKMYGAEEVLSIVEKIVKGGGFGESELIEKENETA